MHTEQDKFRIESSTGTYTQAPAPGLPLDVMFQVPNGWWNRLRLIGRMSPPARLGPILAQKCCLPGGLRLLPLALTQRARGSRLKWNEASSCNDRIQIVEIDYLQFSRPESRGLMKPLFPRTCSHRGVAMMLARLGTSTPATACKLVTKRIHWTLVGFLSSLKYFLLDLLTQLRYVHCGGECQAVRSI